MKKSKKSFILFLLLLAGTAGRIHAFDLPDEALILLARASSDPCSICAQDMAGKAFALLNKTCAPGSVIVTDESCRLVKAPAAGSFDMTFSCYPTGAFMAKLKDNETPPDLVFTFYTPEKRLVGISEKDFTPQAVAELFGKAEPGALFDGRIEIIRYPYGTGEGFIYFKENGRLQIHCRVLELKPADR